MARLGSGRVAARPALAAGGGEGHGYRYGTQRRSPCEPVGAGDDQMGSAGVRGVVHRAISYDHVAEDCVCDHEEREGHSAPLHPAELARTFLMPAFPGCRP
jgi:hypothetical protein